MTTENTFVDQNTDKRANRRGGAHSGRCGEGRSIEGRGSRGRGHGRRHGKGRGLAGMNRGRRKRPLAHGDLRLLILKIIQSAPSHGYGLIDEIKTLTSGTYEPSPGVIYPAIEVLQDLGWAEVRPEKGKRTLYITEAGQSEISEQSEALQLIEDRLAKLASREQGLDPDDIRGAMRQLKFTVVSTFKGQDSDPETRKRAAAILRDAREKIAKLTR